MFVLCLFFIFNRAFYYVIHYDARFYYVRTHCATITFVTVCLYVMKVQRLFFIVSPGVLIRFWRFRVGRKIHVCLEEILLLLSGPTPPRISTVECNNDGNTATTACLYAQRVFDDPTPRPAGVDEQLFNDNSVISVNEFRRAVNTAVYRLMPGTGDDRSFSDTRPDRAKGHLATTRVGRPGFVSVTVPGEIRSGRRYARWAWRTVEFVLIHFWRTRRMHENSQNALFATICVETLPENSAGTALARRRRERCQYDAGRSRATKRPNYNDDKSG